MIIICVSPQISDQILRHSEQSNTSMFRMIIMWRESENMG